MAQPASTATSDVDIVGTDDDDDDDDDDADDTFDQKLWPTEPEIQWQIMKMKMTTVAHVWKIENFATRLRSGIAFESDKFYTLPNSDCSFVLKLQHRDSSIRQLNYLELSLNLRKNDITAAGVQIMPVFRACIVDVNREKSHLQEDRKMLRVLQCETCFVFRKFVLREEVLDKSKGILDDKGVLTIMCSVSFKPVTGDTMFVADSDTVPEVYRNFEDDVHKGPKLNNRSVLFSDVDLQVGRYEFPAHRAILAEHSTVFRAMFEHDTKEKEEQRVVIEDFRKEVVDDMLTYMYTGRAPSLKQLAPELLAIADKYNITGLKSMCVRKLAANILTPTDAVVCWKLGHVHNSFNLRNIAVYWITRNINGVMETAEWQSVSREYRELVDETLDGMAELFSVLTSGSLEGASSSSRVVAESLTLRQIS